MISCARHAVKLVTPNPPALTRFQRLFQELRTEGGTPGRTAAAIGLGIFIGCVPLWGLHLAMCVIAGRLLRLNRLKMYVAANISNPIVLPFLVLGAVQIGRYIRHHDFYELSLDQVHTVQPWTFGVDLVVGSLIIGVVLGAIGAVIALLLTRTPDAATAFLLRVADRYLSAGVTPWEFARQKLTADPVYFDVLRKGVLPSTGRLLDLGCGQGLLLATLATAAAWHREARWPDSWPPPPSLDLHGVEMGNRLARIGRLALGNDAIIEVGDVRHIDWHTWTVITLFDVLHLMPRADQDALLRAASGVLEPGGVLLIREANADASWRFRMVQVTNRLKALVQGRWRQPLIFRSRDEWQRTLEHLGLSVSHAPAARGTPFNNLLLVARKR
jgi:uncharacterized protein (DUF2062 family)/2-polyprenyl-3-methyl-5-hydroxy-6-metoxy-1,4-benzoquinol methylase